MIDFTSCPVNRFRAYGGANGNKINITYEGHGYIRRRSPNAALVVFGGKLRQRGYTRSISGLYKVLRRIDDKSIKLPNHNLMSRCNIPGKEGKSM